MALITQTQPTFVADTEADRTANQAKYANGDFIFVLETNRMYMYVSAGVYICTNGDDQIISPAAFAAAQNDYNPAGLAKATILRLTSTGNQNITGIVAPVVSKRIYIMNIGGSIIVLVNASAASVAANRFTYNGNLTINSNEACEIWYDITTARWRPINTQ